MGIIVKFLIRNIKEKKFRTFLILISVASAAALFFASMGIASTFEKTYIDSIKASVGGTDIYVTPGEKALLRYVNIQDIDTVKDEIDYEVPMILGKGVYKSSVNEITDINLYGYDYKELMKMSPLILKENYNVEPFTGKKIIISKDTSDKFKLTAGNKMYLNINGIKQEFTIAAIAERAALFKGEKETTIGVVPRDTIASLYDKRGIASAIYIKLKDPMQKDRVIKKLSDEYKKYDTKEVIDKKTMNQQIRGVRTPFLMMLIMVAIMCIFIIYTAFKVITLERLPYIGTFRSLGATKRITTFLLLTESIIYGVLGGVIGDLLGFGVLYLMADQSNEYKSLGIKTTISYTPSQLVYAFILAVFIAFISSLIPIIKVSRLSVKDIVLNNIEHIEKKKKYKIILALIFLIIAIVCPYIAPKPIAVILDSLCILISIIAVLMLIPYISRTFVFVFEKVYVKIFGNEGGLAVKNLRNNKSIINNIALLTIGVSSIFMIKTVSFSFGRELTSAYNIFNYDIYMSMDKADKITEQRLLKLDGIKAVQGFYSAYDLKIEGSEEPLVETDGVNTGKFLKYLNVDMVGNPEEVLKNFDKDRNIIITNFLKEKLNKKKGDIITFKMPNGKKDYKIVGFFETSMQDGSYVFIPERFFKLDTGDKYYGHIAIKTDGSVESVKTNIKKEFIKNRLYIKSINEFKKLNSDDFSKLISMLSSFSIIAAIIGIFGVLNNFIISFIERKHSLAVLASVGMSKRQRVKMLFIEALTIGIIGGTCGILTGILISNIVPFAVRAIGMPFDIYFSGEVVVYCLISAIIVTIIASIAPGFKASKMNIVESLKYE